MVIPRYVLERIERLEQAGFAAFVVGGCVRDGLLGLEPHDYDICTAALPEQTEALFSDHTLGLEGKKHGTIVVHTEGGEIEITTFRTEGAYLDNRHPDWVEFVPEVERDLARRDFTVNAMAYSPTRGLADPFGGQKDLKNGILRTVGDPEQRFREDSLRILRGLRFAARFSLVPEQATQNAMDTLAPLTDNLARERVFEELSGFLRFARLSDLLRAAPVLSAVIPELKNMVGFDQRSPHHAYDLYTHTAHVTAGVRGDSVLRWAALLHDTGKIPCFTQDETGRGHFYGHADAGAKIADEILQRLRAPAQLRQQVTGLIALHMTRLEEDEISLKRWLARMDRDTLERLLCLQEADMTSKGTDENEDTDQFRRIRVLLEDIRQKDPCLSLKQLALKGGDLMAEGYRGKAVGEALEKLLEAVLEEQVPNEKEALLAFLKAGN